jgi:hypothetical protein
VVRRAQSSNEGLTLRNLQNREAAITLENGDMNGLWMNPIDLMDGRQIVNHVATMFGGKTATELKNDHREAMARATGR